MFATQKEAAGSNAAGAEFSLRLFFAPQSVAVIGASPKPDNLGGKIVASMQAQGFAGTITLVHPDGKSLHGCNAVRRIDDLPEGVDLAVAAVPASAVPGLVKPLAGRNVHHLIVTSGGFAETGAEGEILQNHLQAEAKKFGVRVIGPNGLGVFSAPDQFNSFFLTPEAIRFPKPGKVGLLSQSGAFLSLALNTLAERNIGVQRAVNFGNRIDVGETELLELFLQDPAIEVIGMYLESIADGPRLVRAAIQAKGKKPIVIWKGGREQRGSDAAQAHSASLAGSYEVFQAACAKAGIVEVFGFEAFAEALEMFAAQPVPNGPRVLVVSNGGGMGVFLTDLCERYGLQIPKPSGKTRSALSEFLPPYYSMQNPIDLTGSGTNAQCLKSLDVLLNSGEFDNLLLVLLSGTQGIHADIATDFHRTFPQDIPLAIAAYGEALRVPLQRQLLRQKIPVFSSAESAVRALSVLEQQQNIRKRFATEATPDFDVVEQDGFMWPFSDRTPHEMQLKEFLKQRGIEVPKHKHVQTPEDLNATCDEMGFPLVLKVVKPELKHKLEIYGVQTGIDNPHDLFRKWQDMQENWPGSIWVEQQMPDGLELMVGAYRDPQFGPVLLFGTGGPYVETLGDIQRILEPATSQELEQLIDSTRAGKIIAGIRSQTALAKNRLSHFLQEITRWVRNVPAIESLDFNPVRLYEHRLVVLDAKCTLKKAKERRD